MLKNKRSIILLIIIVLFGSFFRFLNINYQLPELYLPDEQFFINPALHIANGHLNPGWFGAGQLIIYAIGFLFRSMSFVINLFSHTDFPAQINYQNHLTLFYTSARILFALCGILMIPAIYHLTKFWNKRTALISAFLVASSFYLIDHSHIIRPDIPQTLFIILFLIFLFKILDDPKKNIWYVLSGISIGAAFTTKYPALFMLPIAIIIIVWLIKKKEFLLKKWAVFIVTSILSAFVTGPFLFISFSETLKQIEFENSVSHGVHGGLGILGNLWWYLFHTLHWEMGTFNYILAISVISLLSYRIIRKKSSTKEIKMLIICASAIFYIFSLSFLNLHWERWAIPSLALLFIPTAVALDYLSFKIRNKLLLSMIVIFILIGPTLRLARTVHSYNNPHTIEQAKQWMLDNIPKQSTIIREPYTPEMPMEEYNITTLPNLGYDKSSKYYKDNSTYYFAISESVYGVILERAKINGEENFLNAVTNYNHLISKSTLLYEIKPNSRFSTDELISGNDISIIKNFTHELFMGPYIRVYKFNNN